jgi:hypothetical protein
MGLLLRAAVLLAAAGGLPLSLAPVLAPAVCPASGARDLACTAPAVLLRLWPLLAGLVLAVLVAAPRAGGAVRALEAAMLERRYVVGKRLRNLVLPGENELSAAPAPAASEMVM